MLETFCNFALLNYKTIIKNLYYYEQANILHQF